MLAPVWTLRREGDLGIGDTAAVRDLIEWAGEQRLGFLQLLPINETGSDHSPYSAISSVALDPVLLDLSAIPEITPEHIAAARESVPREVFTSSLVDYPTVKRLKRKLLRIGFERFWAESLSLIHI